MFSGEFSGNFSEIDGLREFTLPKGSGYSRIDKIALGVMMHCGNSSVLKRVLFNVSPEIYRKWSRKNIAKKYMGKTLRMVSF